MGSGDLGDELVAAQPPQDRARYRSLHNHLEGVLTAALRDRPGITTALVPVALDTANAPIGDEQPATSRDARDH